LVVQSYEQEDYLLFSGIDADGKALDQETCEKLFSCSAKELGIAPVPSDIKQRLQAEASRHIQATISSSLEANNKHFHEARDKLEKWADDQVLAVEKALKDTKEQIKILQRQARQAVNLEEQHEIQQKIQKLEKQQRKQRQEIFDVEDEIYQKRDGLINALEKRLSQSTQSHTLFTIQWSVI
jgi:predicted  nucleic acid-binding Zn-ribbon protein